MFNILYALSGQGRGHTSRAQALGGVLRDRGHTVTYCCGGTANKLLKARGESPVPVPALRQVLEANSLRLVATLRENEAAVWDSKATVAHLAETFRLGQFDLVVSDFEPFSSRAAALAGIPVVSLNHQEIVTQGKFELEPRYWPDLLTARAAVALIAPRNPQVIAITTFFYPPLRNPGRVVLLPPIIRPEVARAAVRRDDHVLVYCTDGRGMDGLLDVLARVETRFVVYNLTLRTGTTCPANVTLKPASESGFVADLASCRAVICTAGFTLISEALFLKKPLLVLPNHGQFEQILNALYLSRGRMGEAVIGEPLSPERVRAFLRDLDRYVQASDDASGGLEQGADVIEQACTQRIPASPASHHGAKAPGTARIMAASPTRPPERTTPPILGRRCSWSGTRPSPIFRSPMLENDPRTPELRTGGSGGRAQANGSTPATNGQRAGTINGYNGQALREHESTNLNRYTTDSRIYRWHTDAFHDELLDLVRLSAPTTILDAGCGEGFVADLIAQERPGCRITGIDADPDAIAYARARFGRAAQFEVASIFDLPYEDDTFDLVICSEVLEHLDNPMEAVDELIRVSRRHVLITVPREPVFQALNEIGKVLRLCDDPGHVQFWTKDSFQEDFEPLFDRTTFRWKHTYQLLLGGVR